ncbi:helix-turn-helix transcriptional regulator [Insolitispirillum peregrinum]|uniref:helix-turn-helix transcriptional regulator n=1 Tax=Insolitispirillum peregrinum TaxID=80876 RepID=UPI00361DB4D5
MKFLLALITPSTCAGWQYWRPPNSPIVELGTVCGTEVALPVHFHNEDQVTFVIDGQRTFIISNRLITVPAGHGIHIPARTPHRSLAGQADVIALNIYTIPGTCAAECLLAELSRYWHRGKTLNGAELTAIVEACLWGEQVLPYLDTTPEGLWGSIGHTASLSGMSREGFSRRFKRLYGMAPQTFQVGVKLNNARQLLRSQQAIADVAAETGFADQSHLGRWFRRCFGVTPGHYRLG